MVRDIVKDIKIFKKAVPATIGDITVAKDLFDTLNANLDICVGMAANMIGVNKRIIAFVIGPMVITMINPVITKKSGGSYEAMESCLSLEGERKAVRYKTIEVEYYDMSFKKHINTYSGFSAQIIQHEIDHCDGVVI